MSVCSLFLCLGCSQGDAAEQEAGEATVVGVETVKRRPVARVLTYSGDVVGEVEVKVYSIIPDRIVSLRVEEGQEIDEGELVAIIRADALGQGVQQALGGLASARAQVAGLRDTLGRQQRLVSSGVVTQAQLDGTRFQLQAAEAQMAQLDATVGSARTRRSDANIRSPIAGVVGQVFVEEGDMAAPQIPICTVVRMERVEVQINVPERELGMVRAGMEAEIRIASLQEKVFRAPVSRISPVVDRLSRSATLRMMLDNPEHAIRPGSLADVRLEVERHDGAIVVPQYALVLDERQGDGGEAIFRAYVLNDDGNTVTERRIRVGIYEGDNVEVVEGLNEGDRLIVQGQHLLREGSSVTVTQGESKTGNRPERASATAAAQATTDDEGGEQERP